MGSVRFIVFILYRDPTAERLVRQVYNCQAIDELIGSEGGYVNHPADRGGPTRFGITEAVARSHGYGGDMRSLPRADAVTIYRRLYWLRPGFDRVAERAPKVAAELFDTAVNMGPETAVGF